MSTNIALEADSHVAELTTFWNKLLPLEAPSTFQFSLWLALHSPEIVRWGITEGARKYHRLAGGMTFDRAIKFCSRVMNERKRV